MIELQRRVGWAMKTWARVTGVIALIVGIAFALIYLNSSLYSFWAAGVPHGDENAEAWIFRAYSNLGWAIAAALGGVAFFVATRARPRTRAACILSGLAAVLVVLPWAREFVATDICLDSGGIWSKSEFRCHC